MYIKCTLSRPLDAAASLPRTQSCPPPHAFAFEAPSTHSHVPLGARRATSRKRNRRAGKRSTVSVQLTCRVLQGAAFSPLKHQRRVTSWCATTPTHLTANQQYTASVPLHSLARPKPCVPPCRRYVEILHTATGNFPKARSMLQEPTTPRMHLPATHMQWDLWASRLKFAALQLINVVGEHAVHDEDTECISRHSSRADWWWPYRELHTSTASRRHELGVNGLQRSRFQPNFTMPAQFTQWCITTLLPS